MTASVLRIALAQLNVWVGDIEGNARRIIEAATRARDGYGADLLVFPEMALIGYPPDDLLLHQSLPQAIDAVLARLSAPCWNCRTGKRGQTRMAHT